MLIKSSEINHYMHRNTAGYVSAVDEAYNAEICQVAKHIFDECDDKPVVLLSGPSGSGKTTTAKMLERYLDHWGCTAHTISMDNYFSPFTPEQRALADVGKLDLESPQRMDIPLLNDQIRKIIAGKTVEIPKYDFATTSRLPGQTLKRGKGDIVIFEGIHALNSEVVTVPDSETTRIYVSVRTRLFTDGQLLHPEKIRLLRRMLRDRVGRSRSITETLQMYDNVQAGENRYIMPYKHRRSFDIDTFIAYEASVYKTLLLPELEALTDDPRIADLVFALERLDALDPAAVPRESLIREFIGGSEFE